MGNGRLSDEVKHDVMASCSQILNSYSVTQMLHIIFPLSGSECKSELAAEFILWADKYGRRRDTVVIPARCWPSVDGEFPLLSQRRTCQRKRSHPRKSWHDRSNRTTRRKRTAWDQDENDNEMPWAEYVTDHEEYPSNNRIRYTDDADWASWWQSHSDSYRPFLDWRHEQPTIVRY